ncbi:MAG: glycosyltransferase family 2 protein [Sulfitobacter sp.]
MLSILIPAHDEAGYIAACLGALVASDSVAAEVIVIANGCRDETAQIARSFAGEMAQKGWRFEVIELAQGGKLGALNAGEAAARGEMLAYLDADVIVSPPLMAQLAQALAGDAPRYASGTPQIAAARTWVTRAYARFWQELPFVRQGVPGFGIFAVNRAGRARWQAFPPIISDDTFVRLSFAPDERIKVAARYCWPMVEGFGALVRVRRRQDAGVAQVARLYPQLLGNDDLRRAEMPLWRRLLRDPVGFGVYGAVALATKARRDGGDWARGR